MIDIKEAVAAAQEFIGKLYPSVSNFALEEVQRSDDLKYWLITLGFLREKPPVKLFGQTIAASPQLERVYKLIKVNAENGEAVAMQIRQV